jgi:hypothetical protein
MDQVHSYFVQVCKLSNKEFSKAEECLYTLLYEYLDRVVVENDRLLPFIRLDIYKACEAFRVNFGLENAFCVTKEPQPCSEGFEINIGRKGKSGLGMGDIIFNIRFIAVKFIISEDRRMKL